MATCGAMASDQQTAPDRKGLRREMANGRESVHVQKVVPVAAEIADPGTSIRVAAADRIRVNAELACKVALASAVPACAAAQARSLPSVPIPTTFANTIPK